MPDLIILRRRRAPLIARSFSGATDMVTCSIGALEIAGGPITMAAICRITTDAGSIDHYAIRGRSSGDSHRWALFIGDSGQINYRNSISESGGSSATHTFASDGWVLIAATKNSGTVEPRIHRYKYSTREWIHETASAPLANGTSADASSLIEFGNENFFENVLAGDMLVAAVFPYAQSDAQVETLPYRLQDWFRLGPGGLWTFNQTNTGQRVLDRTPGRADQTSLVGTSVLSEVVIPFDLTP